MLVRDPRGRRRSRTRCSASCSSSTRCIGIVQELRAKRTLDRLAVLERAHGARSCATASVHEIAVDEVVLDDLLELRAGDQVPADGVVRARRRARDRRVAAHRRVRPGRQGRRRRGALGQHRRSRARAGSRRRGSAPTRTRAGSRPRPAGSRSTRSELMDGINLILRFVTWAIVPTAVLLAFSQFRAHDGWREAMSRRRRRRRGDGARGPRAADEPRVRGRGGDARAPPGAGAGAARGRRPRARRRRAASTRPARSPRARSCSTRSSRSTRHDADRRRARRARRRREPQRDRSTRSPRRSPRRTAGRAPARCRSRRRGSGARPRSTAAASWVLGAPEMVWVDRPADDPGARAAPTSSRPRAGACCCSRTATRRSPARRCPTGLEAGRARDVRGEDPARRGRDARATSREQGVALQGDLRRQPAHRRRGRARASGSPAAGDPVDARELPEDQDELADVLEQHVGVRPGHAAAEARDRRRAAVDGATSSR